MSIVGWFCDWPTLYKIPMRKIIAIGLAGLLALGPMGLATAETAPERPNLFVRGLDVVVDALSLVGTPYKLGGLDRRIGLDCSGLVVAVYEKALGVMMPRTSKEQAQNSVTIADAELTPGDLVFFKTPRGAFTHVGIYIGEGQFVHAPRAGGRVRIESMDVAYWKTRYNGARRLLEM